MLQKNLNILFVQPNTHTHTLTHTHTHTHEYYSTMRKEEILPFVTTQLSPEELDQMRSISNMLCVSIKTRPKLPCTYQESPELAEEDGCTPSAT